MPDTVSGTIRPSAVLQCILIISLSLAKSRRPSLLLAWPFSGLLSIELVVERVCVVVVVAGACCSGADGVGLGWCRC